MKTIEVNRNQWENFCECVSESHHGARIQLEMETVEPRPGTQRQDTVLKSMRIDDHTDPCNTLLIIETGGDNEKGMPHRIIEPLYIKLRNGSGDRYTRIEIMAESGTTTLIMHPGLTAEIAS